MGPSSTGDMHRSTLFLRALLEKMQQYRTVRCKLDITELDIEWVQSRWHNPQKVVYMDPHLEDM